MYANGLINVRLNTMPKRQKFPMGMFVRIAKDLGDNMSHFTSDTVAIVEFTYAHAFGGGNVDSYSLIVKRSNGTWSSSAWYYENQLTLIEDEAEIKKLTKNYSDRITVIPSKKQPKQARLLSTKQNNHILMEGLIYQRGIVTL